MPLPDEYLVYPHRKAGPDHDRYDATPIVGRPPLALPGGGKVALWVVVPLEFFPLNPSGKPFKAPGAMQTPYPDLRHYTTRDYGNRIGVYRVLKVLDALGITATFPIQGAVAERYPTLVADIVAAGHEVAAHGWDTDSLHVTGLDAAVERRWITDTVDALTAAGALRPTGWLSPARSQGFDTPDLLAEEGFRWCADWAHDDLPTPFRTRAGTLAALPLSPELDDWQILMTYKRPESEWVTQLADAADWLLAEAQAAGGARVLSVTLRPYIMGQPYRVRPLRDSLARVLDRGGVEVLTGGGLAALCPGL